MHLISMAASWPSRDALVAKIAQGVGTVRRESNSALASVRHLRIFARVRAFALSSIMQFNGANVVPASPSHQALFSPSNRRSDAAKGRRGGSIAGRGGRGTKKLDDGLIIHDVSAVKHAKDTKSIIATEDRDLAIKECREKVAKISRECRMDNVKYRDPHFDLSEMKSFCLHGLRQEGEGMEGVSEPAAVRRVEDIYDQPKFIVDGIDAGDIKQGGMGDCWFLAAICVARDEQVGVYGFIFFRDGGWVSEVIDDQLFVTHGSYDEADENMKTAFSTEEQYINAVQRGSNALHFAKCADSNETWLPLLEKAFAKAHGDYSAIEGGFTGEAVEDLTGGRDHRRDILDKDRFWKEEMLKVNKELLFAGGITGVAADEVKGIITGHAYSVLKAVEVHGKRLVQLRNPWGQSEWTGAWSDGSPEWTAEWMTALNHRFGDDGAFWMSYEDFLKTYTTLDRTRIFSSQWTVSQCWAQSYVPWPAKFADKEFRFELKQSSPVVLVLQQVDNRYFVGLDGQYMYRLHFRVCREGETEYFARSKQTIGMTRSVNKEVHLSAGAWRVTYKVSRVKCGRATRSAYISAFMKDQSDKFMQIATNFDYAFAKGLDNATQWEDAEEEEEGEEEAINEGEEGGEEEEEAEGEEENPSEEDTIAVIGLRVYAVDPTLQVTLVDAEPGALQNDPDDSCAKNFISSAGETSHFLSMQLGTSITLSSVTPDRSIPFIIFTNNHSIRQRALPRTHRFATLLIASIGFVSLIIHIHPQTSDNVRSATCAHLVDGPCGCPLIGGATYILANHAACSERDPISSDRRNLQRNDHSPVHPSLHNKITSEQAHCQRQRQQQATSNNHITISNQPSTDTMSAALAKAYDYIVIGGGSGGVASARRAATYGAKVLLVERGRANDGMGFGGTCVNYGCVPKKVMFNASAHVEHLTRARDYSIKPRGERAFAFGDFDWAAMKHKRDAYIERLNGIYERNLSNAEIDVEMGVGQLLPENKVQVNGKVFSGKHILVAVGGRPSLPAIPGIEHVIDSDGFFKLETQPKKVAVVGAGYIAVEMAGIFNTLKTDTSLFCRYDHVLRQFDPIVRDLVNEEMEKSGVTFVRQSRIERIDKRDDGTLTITATVHGETKTFAGFDTILYAIGREPRTKDLGLEAAGVALTPTGHIIVDAQENTSAKGVCAIGDATTTGWELTPVAIAAGRRLADRLFGNEPDACLNYKQIPTVVFSHPPLGTIGYTEPQAIEAFGAENVKVYTSKFVNLLYAMSEPEHKAKTAMKLVCVGENETVVGLHVAGEGADEMLQGFGVAIKMNATKADFDNIVAIHPTAAEEFVTMAPWGTIRDKIQLPPAPARPAPTPKQ
ncbi:TPA: LOW QUALITY PROTEIN: hypothetical protein N0F65_005443 [Lagenidium giganteum]|uniref:Glutathione reductase n=1 Tax=Lagenidium giganteum TaxID=4803 RepID=A0AAV2YWF3_9STRA|nr:TPA: LOW QUALITY PROTEIN: hypothetical protein N0F65_005443 [Lagenidium giganteum]